MPLQTKKILIIRFSSIGDIVLTTPVIRCLKLQTGATIHFITKKSYATLLEASPYITTIFTIKKGIKELLPILKAEKYDYVIDLHKNLRSSRLAYNLGVKRYTFDKLNIQKWLMVRTKINRLPDMHIVDRYMQAVSTLGVKNDGQGLDYFIPQGKEAIIADFFKNNTLFSTQKNYIAFAIGAAHATKRLPKERIISICQQIKQPIILLGGSDEAAVGKLIAQQSGSHVSNACGKSTLHQSASLIQQASQVITHDTGMMHIAAAFQKPIISLWGNTIPEFGMHPYYKKGVHESSIIEVKGLSCRPCSKIGYNQCPKGHFKCMNDLNEAEILNHVIGFDKKEFS